MYQDAGGRRLTLYARRGLDGNRETAFRFAEQDGVGASTGWTAISPTPSSAMWTGRRWIGPRTRFTGN